MEIFVALAILALALVVWIMGSLILEKLNYVLAQQQANSNLLRARIGSVKVNRAIGKSPEVPRARTVKRDTPDIPGTARQSYGLTRRKTHGLNPDS